MAGNTTYNGHKHVKITRTIQNRYYHEIKLPSRCFWNLIMDYFNFFRKNKLYNFLI